MFVWIYISLCICNVMGLSYIMDSVLYICLAITFVLILLIVYHFKQRVSALEAKQDTMFELVNNMVQEMQNIRANSMPPSMPPSMQQEMHDAIFSELSGMPSMIHIGGNQGFMNVHNTEDHSVEELETDDEDDDSEEDDDDDDEDTDEDSDSDADEEEQDINSVKQIQVESTTLLDEIPSEHLSANDVEETIIDDTDALVEIDYEKEKELSVSKSDELHTESLEEVIPTYNEQESTNMKYKDLDLRQLKALANERGLATNTNRMKKAKLIDILEKADATENNLDASLIDE